MPKTSDVRNSWAIDSAFFLSKTRTFANTLSALLLIFLSFVIIDTSRVFVSHAVHKDMRAEPLIPGYISFPAQIAVIFGLILLYAQERKAWRRVTVAHKAIIFALASLAEWRDPETGDHLARTSRYASVLAREIRKKFGKAKKVDSQLVHYIQDASILHDIGKVGIPDAILLKPGKLTEEERNIIKQHVLIGRNIIEKLMERFSLNERFFLIARNIAAYHHERYDGYGYPEGKKGDEIPIEARIFAVCDVFDALTSQRPYKAPLSCDEAMEIILSESGKHFDPDIVETFLECRGEIERIRNSFGH